MVPEKSGHDISCPYESRPCIIFCFGRENLAPTLISACKSNGVVVKMKIDYQKLAQAAIDAKAMSYSPYSQFQVGAALLTKDGKIYTGCNVESAAFSPTNCAERTAIFKAVSEGYREFFAIAVAGSPKDADPDYCYPCGVCRQVLREFATDDLTVIVVKTVTDYRIHKLGELLPHSFGL